MTFAPAVSRFSNQIVLLIGSSAVAVSLVRRLVCAAGRIRWFSRGADVAEELRLSAVPRQSEVSFREPRAIDFEEAAAVIATIGEPIGFRLCDQMEATNARYVLAKWRKP